MIFVIIPSFAESSDQLNSVVTDLLSDGDGVCVSICLDRNTSKLNKRKGLIISSSNLGSTDTRFMAGYARDIALSSIEHIDDDDVIIFLDADCNPCNGFTEMHKKFHDNNHGILQGVRKNIGEYTYNAVSHDHIKETRLDTQIKLYTHNMSMTGCIYKRLISFIDNGGRLFHKAFDGNWGFEDVFVGDIAKILSMPIYLHDKSCIVYHTDTKGYDVIRGKVNSRITLSLYKSYYNKYAMYGEIC